MPEEKKITLNELHGSAQDFIRASKKFAAWKAEDFIVKSLCEIIRRAKNEDALTSLMNQVRTYGPGEGKDERDKGD